MLTPVDIQNKIFKGGIGYDKKDVETFMHILSSDYEMLYRSNIELKDKIAALNESLQHYRATEDSMQKALTLSEKTAEETVIAANEEARRLIAEAQKKAEETIADAQEELLETKNQIAKLQQQHKKFKKQFTKILRAQLEALNGEVVDIDLGADFENKYDNGFGNGFGSYAGESNLGGLGSGGGYMGNFPDGFEHTNQDSSFNRVSLNMDPFADAANGGGRFSKQSTGRRKGKETEQKISDKISDKGSDKGSDKSSFKPSESNNAAVTGNVENKVKESTMLDSEDNYGDEFHFVSDNAETIYADDSSIYANSTETDKEHTAYSGEVEDKVNESTMLDSEDNYDDGFEFVVGNDNKENDIPTILTDNNDVLEGDVEDKHMQSNLIGNGDDEEDGFTFL